MARVHDFKDHVIAGLKLAHHRIELLLVAGGLFVEYSGPLLAVWKMVKMILMVVMLLFGMVEIMIFHSTNPMSYSQSLILTAPEMK